jgi:membrane dipeptidase
MAIFIPTNEIAEFFNVTHSPDEYFYACLDVYRRELEANSDLISPILSFDDFSINANNGKMSAILTIEDGVIVYDSLAKLKELFDLGVRLISLTWNFENCFGFPQSTDPELMKLGLKPFGIEAVRCMNELGIIVDVSHLSEGGFDDVAMHAKKPFTASHSCARALCNVSRNLTDRQLKVLGDKGGICGVNFAPQFLIEGATSAGIDDVVRHIRHIPDVAGVEAVAFGSDFDGFNGEIDFNSCDGMPLIVDALSEIFSHKDLEKICNGNALRLFGDTL